MPASSRFHTLPGTAGSRRAFLLAALAGVATGAASTAQAAAKRIGTQARIVIAGAGAAHFYQPGLTLVGHAGAAL